VLLGVVLGLMPLLAAAASPVDVQVLDSRDSIVLQYTLGDYRSAPVAIDGGVYERVYFDSEPVMQEVGEPAMPQVCRSVIIDTGSTWDVRVLDAQYYEVRAQIVPSRGPISRNVDPDTVPYTFGDAYGTDAFFPGDLAVLGTPYTFRDFDGVTVQLRPFQYNPVTGVMRVYTDVTLEVYPAAPTVQPVLAATRQDKPLSRAFSEIYARHFLNYEVEDRYAPLNEDGELLIIAHDAWLANVEPLVTHKLGIGIDTSLVGVSTIPGGNTSTAIKNYIQSVYDDPGRNLAFVLLVGDASQVATPMISVNPYTAASDPTYSTLAGTDYYPEIIVGRFSAQSAGDVDTQVLRTIEYENMQATQQEWFWRGTGIGSQYGTGDDGEYDWEHIDNFRDMLLAHGYTQVDQFYGTGSPTAAQVAAALNAGRGIINYCGHGGTTDWGTTGFANSHIDALTNDNMLPFICSVACLNGNFSGSTCFGEAWLRATHNGEPTGAIGAYMSSINQPWDPPMEGQDEFNYLYVNESYHTYGALCYAGSCSMIDDYPGTCTYGTGPGTFMSWHIFGDPTVCVVGTPQPPTGLRVTPSGDLNAEGLFGGPFTPDHKDYLLENLDPTPLDYEVTHSEAWVSVTNTSGTLPAGGTTVVTVSINATANGLPNGDYADVVSFANLTGGVGDTTRDVTLRVGVPTVQFEWTLDSDPGWSVEGQWQFGHPTGLGGSAHGNPDPTDGATGSNVYGVNLSGDYSTTPGGPYYLTLGPLDLSDMTQTSLLFDRWLNSDYQPYVTATVEISTDGAAWTEIWDNGSDEIEDSAWSTKTYDIASLVDEHDTVYIRWGYRVGSAAWAYSGWNIDDVRIKALPVGPYYLPGDLNCDGAVDNFDISAFVLVLTSTPPDYPEYYTMYPDCNHMLADINGDGGVDNFDIGPFVDVLLSP
jgi:hypothetical protein